MGILIWLWSKIGDTVSYLVPSRFRPEQLKMAAKVKTEVAAAPVEPSRLKVGLWWILHIIIVAVILVALWFVNYLLDLPSVLNSNWPWLHKFWLPLLFLLGYALCWLGWYLWKMLGPERETEPYADIDQAWAEGVNALKEAGIDLTLTPLFLVLGRPSGSMDDLFFASQLPLQVRSVPRRAEAPLHVYANKEGIFVTCEGASLLGRAAELLAAPENLNQTTLTLTPPPNDSAPAALLQVSAPNTEKAATAQDDTTAVFESKQESSVAQLLLPEPSGQATKPETSRQPLLLLQNIDEAEKLTARLKYLCRLIARNRQPYCTVNGLFVLMPLAATDNDADAHQTGLIVQRDLKAARESLRVRCPVQTALCDLEKMPGFLDLMGQFAEARQRQQLLGRTFPLAPQLDPEQFPRMVSGGLEWLCQSLLPSVVYQFLQMEKGGEGDAEETLKRNARLVYMLGQLRERQPRWSHILSQGIAIQEKQLPMLGGAFLCATGPDAAREQAFVHDVFRLLIENQNAVAWTPEALDEDRDYLRWARLGYAGIAVLAAGSVFLMYLLWLKA